MDQFRQVGEVLGSLKALMVLKDDIAINQRQCNLLLDIFSLAFETITDEIRRNLRLEEKNTKWKPLEHPMRELYRVIKEGELYIRNCMDIRDFWSKAISLHQNKDCVEFHIHNLFCCFPVVIEAIQTAGEISGLDSDDMQKRRQTLTSMYDGEFNDPNIFQWKYGKQCLVSREICKRLNSVWREDKWLLLETIREKKILMASTLARHEHRLGDFLIKKLNGSEPLNEKLLPSWILVGARDYHVKRRLGSGTHFKEIHWLGENFALRHFFGEIEPLNNEISLVMSLSHPNVMQYLCGFYDEEKKECFVVMELMNKNLSTYIKENCGQRKRIPFSQPVAVDIMLQIARGMEYLHSKKIYHGDLNASNILLKSRNSSTEGYYYAKITGFGLNSIKNYTSRSSSNQNGTNPSAIWYAPEVLAEQEKPGCEFSSKYTEKADVYSFGMLCFQILSGKISFEDGHLEEDKMGRNIRAGERPLFPLTTPKYLSNLTKKCWQNNPIHRPTFSAICRILRYTKKCLVINPYLGQPESPPPLIDFCDIEAGYSKKFLREGNLDLPLVSQIPFQMLGYRLVEKEKSSGSFKEKGLDLANETGFTRPGSICGDESNEDLFLAATDQRSAYSEVQERKRLSRIGADQRSVCSEAPQRKIFSMKAANQRSIPSEFPWRKIDERSVGSVTPETKISSTIVADERSVGSEIPESENFPAMAEDERFVCYEIVESKISATSVDQKSASSKIPEKNVLSQTASDPKTVSSEIKTLRRTGSDEKSCLSQIQEKKVLSPIETDQSSVCSEIPEKKLLSPISTDQSSVFSEIPKKRIGTKKASNRRFVRTEIPDRKVLSKKKLTEGIIRSPGTRKGPLPRSSQTQKPEVRSPKSSPLNQCIHCTKLNGESRSSSTMSPSSRQRVSHASDSEMA